MINSYQFWKPLYYGNDAQDDHRYRPAGARIAAGEFTNDSEYIRDLIRRDQAGQANFEAIRAALIKAEKSGEPRPFDGDQFKQEMFAKHGGRKG